MSDEMKDIVALLIFSVGALLFSIGIAEILPKLPPSVKMILGGIFLMLLGAALFIREEV